VYLKHFGCLSPTCGNVVGLFKELLNLFLFVQVTHKLALQIILHIVDEEMHDCLGHAVRNVPSHNEEVRLDQPLCQQRPHTTQLMMKATSC